MPRVFTNGCFDVIHIAHIELLEFCKRQGRFLIVGINSDESVRRLKGSTRPINTQNDRKRLLLALRCVDHVIIFDEPTPYNLICSLKPDVLVKGGDYDASVTDPNDPKYIVGSDIAKKVIVFGYKAGYSTTNILSKI